MQEFTQAWLGLIVDLSIKSMLLAVVAGIALVALRVRDTNLHHKVWTAVLFGMLAMPALVYVTPAIPLPRWMNIAIPEATAEARPVGNNADGRLVATPPRGTTDVNSDAILVAASGSDAFPDPMMSGRLPPAPNALRPAVANDLPTKDPVPASAPVAGRPSVAVQIASRLPVVLASLYFAVAAIYAVRLITGLWLTYRLIRQARQIDLPAISESPRRNLRFLESESIHVPATVGFLRPVVLLPSRWRQWSETKLQAVLAHELAHVRRADWLVITLAELNRAIYWFHPLAWFLRRRLSELAELNCDDAVLEAEGDRTQYARYLLEVAASLTAAGSRYRPPLSGVAMARKPNVETRIDAILDAGRPLARRLGTFGAVALLLIGSTAILLTAALRTAADDGAKKPGEEIPMKQPATNESRTALQSRPARETAQESRPTDNASVPPQKRTTIHGRAIGIDGQPAAGTDVAVISWSRSFGRDGGSERLAPLAETKTDADGRYRIELAGVSSKTHRDANVIASASGTALAWRKLSLNAADVEASFELQPEETIFGRLVDLEGQPAKAVRLFVTVVMRQVGNDQWPSDSVAAQFGIAHPPAPWPQAMVSGERGQFVIHGVPKNHGVELYVEGDERFAPQEIDLNTGLREQRNEHDGGYHFLVRNVKPGEEAVLPLAPAQMFTGTVRYEDTSEPAPHARLTIGSSQQKGGAWLNTEGRADETGRYRISPRPGTFFIVNAFPPDHTPHIPRQLRFIPWEESTRSRALDVTLARGVLIKGRVLEQGSDAPIAGAYVQYDPGGANRTDRIVFGWPDMHRSDNQGQFEIAVPSGPGNIIIRAPRDEYVFQETSDGELMNGRAGGHRKYAHRVERIDPAPNAAPSTLDFHLQRGATVSGELVDEQGTPIEEAAIVSRLNVDARQMDCNMSPVEAKGGRFEISSLAPDQEYPVYLLDRNRRLGATVLIKAGIPSPRVVLEPCGSFKMRFVDHSGKPIPKFEPWVYLIVTPGSFDIRSVSSGTALGADTVFVRNVDLINHPNHERADDNGWLTLSALIPGAMYAINTRGDLYAEFKAASRETIDLGDIVVAPDRGQPMTSKSGSTIHGHILGVDGKPAEGVDVAVIARRTAIGRGGDLEPMGAVLGESKTDSDGQYRIELAGVSSKTHRDAHVIARASGSAVAWRKLNLDAADIEGSLELQPEEAISGRLVDIEGQPAARVRFQVSSMTPRVITDQWRPEGVGLWRWFNNLGLPTAWPAPIVTDGEGRFVIHGVPKDHGVSLEIDGSDRFAPQDVSLNTGMAEQRGERDGTYRPLVKNFKPGEEAVLPLAPAQLFTGTVRYDDTGEPAPHARLTIWASQQKFGSMISVAGKADDNGRYKISPSPGIRFGVTAYPPDGAPYLVAQKGDIPWEDGARSKVVDMRLPRGVLVQGKVVEQDSNTPIAGASVQYHAEEANNPSHKDHILTGWQDIHLTDKEGRFKIVVLPGPGRLLVHAPGDNYVLQETSGQELYKGKPGGRRNYAHAIEKIDPAPDSAPPEILIRLKRGATVRGELVDREAKPIKQAEIFSQLHINALSLWWRGFGVEARDGRFELSGLASDREYPVHFLDSKQRLGATLVAKAGMELPRVVLEPCGDAKMRFVDDAGKPVDKYEPTVELVVTPGALEYSRAAMNVGMLAADADYIANIDRANHSLPEKSDDQGRLTVRALIPGATYRVVTNRNNEFVLSKEFKALANKSLDLGDITVERKE